MGIIVGSAFLALARGQRTTDSNGFRCLDTFKNQRRMILEKDMIEKIKVLPEYQQLVAERTALAWTLTLVMLVVYFGFIMLLAFDPVFFTTIVSGEYISIGFPVGVSIIVFSFLLTGYYVRKANNDFDELTAKIKEAVGK